METIISEVMLLAPVKRVWDCFSEPKHISKWFFATHNYKVPKAVNDLREGGKFNYSMEAKDGSFGYSFSGTIQELRALEKIFSTLDDGRAVEFHFAKIDEGTTQFTMLFEPETKNTRESQKRFWDVVLNNFEKYVENQK